MSISIDISKGVEPVEVLADMRNDCHVAWVDGKRYTFYGRLPFTLRETKEKGRLTQRCADKALILKHADKAKVKELATLETVRG